MKCDQQPATPKTAHPNFQVSGPNQPSGVSETTQALGAMVITHTPKAATENLIQEFQALLARNLGSNRNSAAGSMGLEPAAVFLRSCFSWPELNSLLTNEMTTTQEPITTDQEKLNIVTQTLIAIVQISELNKIAIDWNDDISANLATINTNLQNEYSKLLSEKPPEQDDPGVREILSGLGNYSERTPEQHAVTHNTSIENLKLAFAFTEKKRIEALVVLGRLIKNTTQAKHKENLLPINHNTILDPILPETDKSQAIRLSDLLFACSFGTTEARDSRSIKINQALKDTQKTQAKTIESNEQPNLDLFPKIYTILIFIQSYCPHKETRDKIIHSLEKIFQSFIENDCDYIFSALTSKNFCFKTEVFMQETKQKSIRILKTKKTKPTENLLLNFIEKHKGILLLKSIQAKDSLEALKKLANIIQFPIKTATQILIECNKNKIRLNEFSTENTPLFFESVKQSVNFFLKIIQATNNQSNEEEFEKITSEINSIIEENNRLPENPLAESSLLAEKASAMLLQFKGTIDLAIASFFIENTQIFTNEKRENFWGHEWLENLFFKFIETSINFTAKLKTELQKTIQLIALKEENPSSTNFQKLKNLIYAEHFLHKNPTNHTASIGTDSNNQSVVCFSETPNSYPFITFEAPSYLSWFYCLPRVFQFLNKFKLDLGQQQFLMDIFLKENKKHKSIEYINSKEIFTQGSISYSSIITFKIESIDNPFGFPINSFYLYLELPKNLMCLEKFKNITTQEGIFYSIAYDLQENTNINSIIFSKIPVNYVENSPINHQLTMDSLLEKIHNKLDPKSKELFLAHYHLKEKTNNQPLDIEDISDDYFLHSTPNKIPPPLNKQTPGEKIKLKMDETLHALKNENSSFPKQKILEACTYLNIYTKQAINDLIYKNKQQLTNAFIKETLYFFKKSFFALSSEKEYETRRSISYSLLAFLKAIINCISKKSTSIQTDLELISLIMFSSFYAKNNKEIGFEIRKLLELFTTNIKTEDSPNFTKNQIIRSLRLFSESNPINRIIKTLGQSSLDSLTVDIAIEFLFNISEFKTEHRELKSKIIEVILKKIDQPPNQINQALPISKLVYGLKSYAPYSQNEEIDIQGKLAEIILKLADDPTTLSTTHISMIVNGLQSFKTNWQNQIEQQCSTLITNTQSIFSGKDFSLCFEGVSNIKLITNETAELIINLCKKIQSTANISITIHEIESILTSIKSFNISAISLTHEDVEIKLNETIIFLTALIALNPAIIKPQTIKAIAVNFHIISTEQANYALTAISEKLKAQEFSYPETINDNIILIDTFCNLITNIRPHMQTNNTKPLTSEITNTLQEIFQSFQNSLNIDNSYIQIITNALTQLSQENAYPNEKMFEDIFNCFIFDRENNPSIDVSHFSKDLIQASAPTIISKILPHLKNQSLTIVHTYNNHAILPRKRLGPLFDQACLNYNDGSQTKPTVEAIHADDDETPEKSIIFLSQIQNNVTLPPQPFRFGAKPGPGQARQRKPKAISR